jgi:hypothetical protein
MDETKEADTLMRKNQIPGRVDPIAADAQRGTPLPNIRTLNPEEVKDLAGLTRDYVNENLKVVSIKEKKDLGKHDITVLGKDLKLEITSYSDGFVLEYTHEHDLPIPPFLKQMLGPDHKQTHKSVAASSVVKPRWFHKLLGVSTETLLAREIKLLKRDLLVADIRHKKNKKVIDQFI